MKQVVITSAKRTAIGKFLGSFADSPASDLGAAAVRAALIAGETRISEVDEVIFGHARQAGTGPNPARQVAIKAGIPEATPAFTVNKACGSSLKAILLGAQSIRLGEASCVVVGGMENMSRVPFMLDRARQGYRLGHAQLVDGMYRDGFSDPLSGMIMGETAEKLAQIDFITRQAQDEFALASQRKASAAWEAGRFDAEVVAVTGKDGRGKPIEVSRDEHFRPQTTLEKLNALPAIFKDDGTVSAGNSSGITDGGAALVLMEEELARKNDQPILARLVASTQVGVDPSIMGIAPVPALQQLFLKTGLCVNDIDLFELNEAFAAQVLACLKAVPIEAERLNVNGGSIALGHPIGATGARIVVTLVHEMRRRKVQRGIATLCISGGQGLALLLENV